jgi:hypothetical protein
MQAKKISPYKKVLLFIENLLSVSLNLGKIFLRPETAP